MPTFLAFLLVMLFSDEPEVFFPNYSQPAILHAAHFWREVNVTSSAILDLIIPLCLNELRILNPYRGCSIHADPGPL